MLKKATRGDGQMYVQNLRIGTWVCGVHGAAAKCAYMTGHAS